MIDNPILDDAQLERLRAVESDVFRAATISTSPGRSPGPRGSTLRSTTSAARRIRRSPKARTSGALRPRRRARPRLRLRDCSRAPSPRGEPARPAGGPGRGEPRSVQSVAVLVGYDLPDARNARRPRRRRCARAHTRGKWGARGEGDRQGPPEDDLEDGIDRPSYGAQIFEAVGLSQDVDRHFTGTPSRIGGIGTRQLALDALARRARAYPGAAGACRSSGCTRGAPAASTISEPRDHRAVAHFRGAPRRVRDVRAARRRSMPSRRVRRRFGGFCASGSPGDGGVPLDEVVPPSSRELRRVRCHSGRSRAKRTRPSPWR